MKNVRLNCGIEMPIIGYGVYLVDPSITERCVLDALSVGYRSLDTGHNLEGWPVDALKYNPKEINR